MITARVDYKHNPDGSVELTFTDLISGTTYTKKYKNDVGARLAAGRFLEKMHRTYDPRYQN